MVAQQLLLERIAIYNPKPCCRLEHVRSVMKIPYCFPELDHLHQDDRGKVEESIWFHHSYIVQDSQCSSILAQRIHAPLAIVWSIVRRFDSPQTYKQFISTCVMKGDGRAGSTRDVTVVSGLPASTSTERLEILDDDQHILSFRVLGGEHRLQNYWSKTTLHEYEVDGRPETLIVESYVVDVPEGNSKEDTLTFTDTLVRCNLRSLAKLSERVDLASNRM
ncbi:hypothetical protein O6H91_01G022500 [Diphasiastrum complanatum]|uniref:Uncharacterized protein n=1 Tax=Diphasiastrum complanatum TaxID=34168 RepID=A0ACC2EP49_DIPCM|nr:hypothetical protein O6H91_Y292200 [Diphasiastrum complanatum]KAJ7568193.1 hypothetical protein O6H91_01G022500 [Diphasiastrum complanatum]